MADAETVFVAWLKTVFPTARICTETPDNLADVLPCIQVTRFGGSDDEVSTFDNPNMDFDCYHATRTLARDLAYQVRAAVRNDLPGLIVANTAIGRTRTISGPTKTSYGNPNLWRFTYSAQARLHTLEA